MIFTKSISSTPAELNNLVPLIGTNVLIGTDSGCFSKFDNAIKKLPAYSEGYKSDWSMIGGFILGSVITVGIVYSVDKITTQ